MSGVVFYLSFLLSRFFIVSTKNLLAADAVLEDVRETLRLFVIFRERQRVGQSIPEFAVRAIL